MSIELYLQKLSKVQLNKEVLLQSDDTKVVDVLLLASPLPISELKNIKAELDFEHSFLTPYELSNPINVKAARKHLLNILGTSNSDVTTRRLRDPHLLHYLRYNCKLIDELSFRALCKALVDSSTGGTLPFQVVNVLQLVKFSIENQ